MEAMISEETRLEVEMERTEVQALNFNPIFRRLSYKRRGIYYEQIKRYESYWHEGRLLILQSEKFFENPGSTMRRVFEFLNIDPDYKCSNLSPVNVGTNKTTVDAEVYDYLKDYFEPHNRHLSNYLGEVFNW